MTTKTLLKVTLRDLYAADLAVVARIERQSFGCPWTVEQFRRQMVRSDTRCVGAQSGRILAGFLVYRVECDALVCANLAVDPAYRRMGVGSRLVDRLVGEASRLRLYSADAMARETNRAACELFKRHGFTSRLIPGQFGDEDGIEFERVVYR